MADMRVKNQRGVVLIVALIVLVAMTLAGIALVRSVDTGNIAAGNMAFRQGATMAADTGIEAGIDWLDSQQAGAALNNDRENDGYYATSQNTLDVTNRNLSSGVAVDWDHDGCANLSGVTKCITPSAEKTVKQDDVVLYRYSYIIHRLCSNPIAYTHQDNSCITYVPPNSKTPNRDVVGYGNTGGFGGNAIPYYRITTRVLGPRNTVSYVQSVVHY